VEIFVMDKSASLRDRAASLTASASISVESSQSGIPSAAWPEVDWEEGYPVDEDFKAFEGLPLGFDEAALFLFRELPKAAANCVASCEIVDGQDRWGDPVQQIHFSTGGWSGAESLLGFISSRFDTRHFMESWQRGGHYVFEFEPFHTASAIEARRAETERLGAQPESATAKPGRPEGASS
jgi:hypothetical protein